MLLLFISTVLFVVALAAAYVSLGLFTSFVQMIAAGIAIAASGTFLAFMFLGLSQWGISTRMRNLELAVDDLTDSIDEPKTRKDASADFNEALRRFQASSGHEDTGAAVRELAGAALRSKGFLK